MDLFDKAEVTGPIPERAVPPDPAGGLTRSGRRSCGRPLCLSVACRIFTSSTGLQDDRRGISSSSFSTKLS